MTLRARLEEVNIGLRTPLKTVRGTVLERRGLVLAVSDEFGHIGRGEVSPLPGWSAIDLDSAKLELSDWVDKTTELEGPASLLKLSPEVRAGIDTALWSLRSEIEAVPLWRILGGLASEASVVVNALVVGSSVDELCHAANQALERGYKTLKVKLGFGHDQACIKAMGNIIRSADDSVRVRLDANASWTIDEAKETIASAQRFLGEQLEYVEDPTGSLDGLVSIRMIDVPIAVDELVRGLSDLERVVVEGSADVLVIKPPLIGGLTSSLTLAAKAQQSGIDIVVSSLYDGPVGLAAWCHLAAALGNSRAHGLATASILDDEHAECLIPRNGVIEL